MTTDADEVCTCPHPAEDHVIDMTLDAPMRRCIAFHCPCKVATAHVVKA